MNMLARAPATDRRLCLRTILIFFAILATGLAVMTTQCADPDLWGHVQYGREILQDGVLPRTATWTYAAEGAPWVNHENIAELLLAWTVDTLGANALPWMKLVIASLLVTMMITAARKSGASWLSTGILVALMGSCVQFHWHFRPQILTYLSLSAMLALWQHVFREFDATEYTSLEGTQSRLKTLWLLPPLMCFWANSHGGFAAGVAIMAAYHGLLCLNVVRSTGFQHCRFLLSLSIITLVTVAATLINPYGFGLWEFLLAALKLPRPEISDWGSLEFFSSDSVRVWCLIAVAGISLARGCQRRDVPQLIVLALLLWQGISHCRHLSIFAITCGFWIPRHLERLVSSGCETLERLQPDRRSEGQGTAGSLLAGLLLIASVVRLAPLMNGIPVERSEYPVSAMQYMSDRKLNGKILATFNWAQYAIGCFADSTGPLRHSRVAVDGRFETCYPRVITDICFDFWLGTADPSHRYRSPNAPPFDPAKALELEQPDLVLLCREQRPSARVMEQHADQWLLLYQDSLAQLWGRRSKFENPESASHIAESDRQISDIPQQGSVPWPAFPNALNPQERLTMHSVSTANAE